MIIRTSGISAQDRGVEYHTQFPWEDHIEGIQGGSGGIVLTPNGSYRTAFVEVWGGDVNFLRGEGATIAEAEKRAWEKTQKILACDNHEYEARGYKNGAGFCKHCNHFASKHFTAQDLGLLCLVCQTPTFTTDRDGNVVCDEHHPGRAYREQLNQYSARLQAGEVLTEEEDEDMWQLERQYFAAKIDSNGDTDKEDS